MPFAIPTFGEILLYTEVAVKVLQALPDHRPPIITEEMRKLAKKTARVEERTVVVNVK